MSVEEAEAREPRKYCTDGSCKVRLSVSHFYSCIGRQDHHHQDCQDRRLRLGSRQVTAVSVIRGPYPVYVVTYRDWRLSLRLTGIPHTCIAPHHLDWQRNPPQGPKGPQGPAVANGSSAGDKRRLHSVASTRQYLMQYLRLR